jgi:tetratricopeptide (TPR) repeat protein
LESSAQERQAPYGLEQIVGDIARSIQLRIEKRLHEALACIDGILEKVPHFAPCLLNRAAILADLGRYEEGLADCKKYIAHAPADPGAMQIRDNMRDAAIAFFRQKLAADPHDTDALFRRANVHLHSGDPAQAEREYAALLRLNEGHQGALANQAYALLALDRHEEALAAYERLRVLNPGDAFNHYNRGNVLKDLGRAGAALAAYRQAVLLKPDLAEARVEIGFHQLVASEFAQGWPWLEWRWAGRAMKPHYLKTAQPPWLGDSDAAGKTILVWAEQGLGDSIQFARFVPLLADIAGQVVLRVPATLVALLQSLDRRVRVIGEEESLPAFDCHCPLMSLPLALGMKRMPPMPQAQRFVPDPAREGHWQAWLGPRLRPRIGLAWSGKQVGHLNPTRDMPPAALLPLADIDADFICLQKDISAADADLLAHLPGWRAPGRSLSDFADTAALIAQLDLVVSVDTSVAHLAGALGQPCFLLLRHSGEWRWLSGRADTPWYPSMRILRQRARGDWAGVVAELRGELRQALSRTL